MCFDICNYICLDTSDHFSVFTFLNILYFSSTLVLTTSCRRSLYTFYSNVIFCHFHEDFYWWVTPKSFIIEISPWYMLLMGPNVFPLNSGHWKKNPKITNICQRVTERGPSLWIVGGGGHLWRHIGFWKMLKGDFVHVMHEAAESSEEKNISGCLTILTKIINNRHPVSFALSCICFCFVRGPSWCHNATGTFPAKTLKWMV